MSSPVQPSVGAPALAGMPGRWAATGAAAFRRHGHLSLSAAVLGLVALMILPIPAALLDLLIAFNIACSLLLLMLALYIPGALGLSTFPSLILLSTVFRLALNIASTKQILLHAHAGHVIETFGRLVMGGSVVVGLVVFTIIAIVQFIVVSKGAERVAEVGARFTLDALPGRQMSIEADLRAGNIDKAEARRQRLLLLQESQMHGAMDGAMKFVKGDAIAAMLIALVNIIAGIGIGMVVLGMPFGDAAARFTLLTVGDGMVSQIPSLLTSVAAGVLITRTAVDPANGEQGLAAQIAGQVAAQPMALLACGGALLGFMLVPGFPRTPFILLAASLLLLGAWAWRRQHRAAGIELAAQPRAPAASVGTLAPAAEPGAETLALPLQLRVAGALRARLAAPDLQHCMEHERERLKQELGLPFPALNVRFDDTLEGESFAIDVQEIPGPARRLEPSQPPAETLAQAVAQTVRDRPDAFVGMQEIQSLLKRAQAQLPDLSEELLRAVPLQRVTEVLRRLALEGVSLRYLREIFESLLVGHAREKDNGALCDIVRADLGRFICHRLLDEERRLHAITLDPALESQLRDAIQTGPHGSFISLPPEAVRHLVQAAEQCCAQVPPGRPPVLLATAPTRRFLRRLLAPTLPRLQVVAYPELPHDVTVLPVARLVPPPAPRLRAASGS